MHAWGCGGMYACMGLCVGYMYIYGRYMRNMYMHTWECGGMRLHVGYMCMRGVVWGICVCMHGTYRVCMHAWGCVWGMCACLGLWRVHVFMNEAVGVCKCVCACSYSHTYFGERWYWGCVLAFSEMDFHIQSWPGSWERVVAGVLAAVSPWTVPLVLDSSGRNLSYSWCPWVTISFSRCTFNVVFKLCHCIDCSCSCTWMADRAGGRRKASFLLLFEGAVHHGGDSMAAGGFWMWLQEHEAAC